MGGASAAPAGSSPVEAQAGTPAAATAKADAASSDGTLNTQVGEDASIAPGAAVPETQTGDVPAGTEPSADGDRLDQNPRFKQVNSQRKQAKADLEAVRLENAKLQGRLEALEAGGKAKPDEAAKPVDLDAEFDKLEVKLENGEIGQAEYNKLLRALVKAEVAEAENRVNYKLTAKEKQQQSNALTSRFISENPDFMEARQNGELAAIMKANPMHDEFSAFYEFKFKNAQKEKLADVAAASKEAESRANKNLAAKRHAQTMTGATAAPPQADAGGKDPELADPAKFGGIRNVLLRRVNQRRSA